MTRSQWLAPARLSVVALLLAGCSAGGSPAPTTPPGSSSPQGPPAGAIQHATGATDLILRLEVAGTFVPIGWLVTQAPTFSLYGDGTVIFRSAAALQPSPLGSVIRSVPFRTGRLSEAQVQDLLAFAIGPGGLRTARALYDPGTVADAPSTIFTLNAGGLTKTVSVVALGIGQWRSDQAAVEGFRRLADRLNAIDSGAVLNGTYVPARYRGTLTEPDGTSNAGVRPWPWSNLTPRDWTLKGDPNRLSFSTRTMTAAEIAILAIPQPEGGFQNLILRGPEDGKPYALAIRPLLPDEAS